MSIGSESTSASVHSPADPRVARVPQISAHMSMNVGIRFGTAAPSPFCLIVRKVAYHCQRSTFYLRLFLDAPRGRPQSTASWRPTSEPSSVRRQKMCSEVENWSWLNLELRGSEDGRVSFDSRAGSPGIESR